jgi:hypothetical protein
MSDPTKDPKLFAKFRQRRLVCNQRLPCTLQTAVLPLVPWETHPQEE